MLATEVHRRFISDCNGCDPRPGGHDLHSRAAPSGSELFSCRGAAVRAVLCWCRLRRFPSRRRPPGFWVVLQENGPEFDVLPGFWAVVSVPRCDSRRRLRYNPRSEAFTSLVPRSAAYETAQNFARELASRFFSVSRQICTHHRYVPPTSGTCTTIGCRCWRRGGSRCRWAHRIAARFRVRRRNPAGQARGLQLRAALRR